MGGIKGASAHSVNKALKRKGHVWQDESFDRVLRSEESAQSKAEYICQNPVVEMMNLSGAFDFDSKAYQLVRLIHLVAVHVV